MTADKPIRIQLSRAKGWRIPPNTVKVDRSTRLGNPFTVTEKMLPGSWIAGGAYIAVPTIEDAVACFREMLSAPGERADGFRATLPSLRGKNLACWCKLPAPGEPDLCHAAVLLELANSDE